MKIIRHIYAMSQKSTMISSICIFLALVFAGGACLSSILNLETSYSMRQFQPETHPLLSKEERIKAKFQIVDKPPLLAVLDLRPKAKGTWLEKQRIQRLRKATSRLAQDRRLDGATSIATVEGAIQTREGISIAPLMENLPVKKWRQRILNDPLLTPQLITKNARSTIIVLDRPDLPNNDILDLERKTRRLLSKEFPEASVKIGGLPVMQSQMAGLLQSELGTLSLYCLVAMVVVLGLIFRNFSSIATTIFITVLANIAALAWMSWSGITFSILTTTLPILICVNTVSMVAYTMIHYSQAWKAKQFAREEKWRTILATFSELFIPNLLATLTTAVGFAALMISEAPLIVDYGKVVGISILISWFLGSFALIFCLRLIPAPMPRNWTMGSARWTLPIIIKAKPLFVISCALAALGTVIGFGMKFSAILFDDMPSHLEARRVSERIDKTLGGLIPLDVIIGFPEEYSWNDPQRVAMADELARSLRKLAGIGSAIGLADFLRAANLNKTQALPTSRAEIGEIGFLYSMSPNQPLDRFVTSDGRETRISLRLQDIPGDKMAEIVARVEQEAKLKFPQAQIETANMATTVHVLNNELSWELIGGFWQALALIGVLLLFVYRSWRWALVALIPNVIPAIVLIAAMVAFDTPIKPGIAIIFSIVLGLAFNNTVYYLGRLRTLLAERQKQGLSGLPVRRALYIEGVPCVLSTIPHSLGFLVFMASDFQLNQTFGAYMIGAMFAGLASDLIFLPVMLQLFPGLLLGRSEAKQKSEAMEDYIALDLPDPQVKPGKESEMPTQIAASFLAFFAFALPALSLFSQSAEAKNPARAPASISAPDLSAKDILDRVSKNLSARDEAANVQMRIYEKNGATKDRELAIQRGSQGQKKMVMVRLLAPGDIRGTGLLSVEDRANRDQWLYLPSSKKSRRILSQGQGGSFLGSELSYEDMGGSAGVKFASKILRYETNKKGQRVAVVESSPKIGESAYSKMVSWIPLDTFTVDRTEYFDRRGKLLKTAQFSSYQKYGSNTWRAQKMQVKNAQNGRATVLILRDLEVNKGIDSDAFTVANLEEIE